ncbi:MAG: NAD-dependent epimerase/dehydratase family protein [Bacteroidales bacterium]|nr:NAD-dependent epimerase/dehydratase family protein [Bacteroidales bacterium]HPD96311.1 NAD-dependent epimerase/dehydratase family protein [Tenuifilaceae bacterium]HRX30617.1 NAD-dependent epimerase/dehydratase family protein [Tenuifilaceae bacterium]
MKKILVVGAGGQIGSELVPHFQKIYGVENVVAADINCNSCTHLAENGPFEELDALNKDRYIEIVKKHKIDAIFNLVALLSAKGEKNPQFAWQINIGALMNSLEIAREYKCAIFTPSSIGAFGTSSPLDNTPQDTVMRPNTIYGICKVTGELLGDYYFHRYGVDARSVRFPGIISNVTLPGGGTTDYAVEIYYGAIQQKKFVCPIPAGTYLDMMYMPDALNACVQLMEADPSKLKHRNSFNITAMSFEPEQIANAIRKRMPDFTMTYDVDPVKKAIADSWPNYMNDSCAREEWNWKPKWNLETMTDDMLKIIGEKHAKGLLK